MNHFEFFGITLSFYPDIKRLSASYKENIKKNHPDLNSGSDASEDFTAKNNAAYKVLKSDKKRIHYILTLTETLVEGEKSSLPPLFLMEMMEINEALEEAKSSDLAQTLTEIEGKNNVLWAEIEAIGKQADAGVLEQDTALAKIKNLYLQGKYLDRILDNHS